MFIAGLLIQRSYYVIAGLLIQRSYYVIAGLLVQRSYYVLAGLLIQRSYYVIAGLLIQRSYYVIAGTTGPGSVQAGAETVQILCWKPETERGGVTPRFLFQSRDI